MSIYLLGRSWRRSLSCLITPFGASFADDSPGIDFHQISAPSDLLAPKASLTVAATDRVFWRGRRSLETASSISAT